MTNSEHEEIIILAYGDAQFQFAVQERTTENSLCGCFRWTDADKTQLLALLEKEDEWGKQPWYLDDDGYRLDDEKLFQMSPWAIIDGKTCRKAVQRMMDCDTGKASFNLDPWFQIGD